MENDESEGLISDLLIAEDSRQGNQVSISDCDKVKLANSDRDDEEYLVLNPMKESSIFEIIWKDEEKVIDPSVLI